MTMFEYKELVELRMEQLGKDFQPYPSVEEGEKWIAETLKKAALKQEKKKAKNGFNP